MQITMSDITFGKQSGDSNFKLDVLTSGKSRTKISVGDQTERSTRDARIIDLPPDIDMSQLIADLNRMLTETSTKELDQHQGTATALRNAEEAAKSCDRSKITAFLAGAGKVALEMAQKIGADVAVAAIKTSLELK